MFVCLITKQKKKTATGTWEMYTLQFWHVWFVLFNYLEHRNTYGEKMYGIQDVHFSFLYDLCSKHFSVR
jgi:hypothetical protein